MTSHTDSPGFVVYADGACAPSNPGPCAWGAVILDHGAPVREACGFLGRGTNQVAEISAATEGLRRVPAGAAVELVCDSKYVLNGITSWRKGWERNGWRNSKKEPVANRPLWEALFAEVDQRCVTTRWVRGHNGDRHNERADRLATEGLGRPLGAALERALGAGRSVAPDPGAAAVPAASRRAF